MLKATPTSVTTVVCEYVDVVEELAIERAKELFGATYANVQPHSGSQANAAVYMALCQPGDTVLGMSLAHGGHPDPRCCRFLLWPHLQGGSVWSEHRNRRHRLR